MASSGIPTPFHLPLSTPQSPAMKPQRPSEVKHTASDSKLNLTRPEITVTGITTPTRPLPISPISGALSNVTSNGHNRIPDGMLSREAVYTEAFNAASRAFPQEEKAKGGRHKLKGKIRRALLRKFILRLILGKRIADFVYPWLHPKAR